MVEVKVNWRWCSLLHDEDVARSFYAKLGYSAEETESRQKHFGNHNLHGFWARWNVGWCSAWSAPGRVPKEHG